MFIKKPWGGYRVIYSNPKLTIKILELEPCSSISLQSHSLRSEYWLLLEGKFLIVRNDTTEKMLERKIYAIPKRTKHRLCSLTQKGRILEISLGEFKEDDIVRYADIYGRVSRQ